MPTKTSPPASPNTPPDSVDAIAAAIRPLYRHGAQPLALRLHGHALLDLLTDPTELLYLRAQRASLILSGAIGRLDPTDADALNLLLHLRPDHARRKPPLLDNRRRVVAGLYGVHPETFRRHHEAALTQALALQLAPRATRRGPTRSRHRTVPVQPGPILLNAPNAPRHLGPTDDGHGAPTDPPPPWPPAPGG